MNPRRFAARSIEWEPSADAEFHHGAQHICCNETPNTWPQFRSQLVNRQIWLRLDPALHQSLYTGQFAAPGIEVAAEI